MTQPNWPAELPTGLEWILTGGDGSLSGLAGRTQDAVTATLKAGVALSPGWNNATAAVFADLRRGIPLPLAIIEAIANQLFDTVTHFPAVSNAIAAIKQVPPLADLATAITGTVGDLTDIATFLSSQWTSFLSGIDFQGFLDHLANGLGQVGTGHTATNIETYVGGLISNLFGGSSIGSVLQVPAIPNLPASIVTTGEFVESLIPSLDGSWGKTVAGSLISGITTIEQETRDTIANALGHSGTGHTAANILAYLGAIPGSVISGALTGATLAGSAITSALSQVNIPSLTSGWAGTLDGARLVGSVAATLVSGALSGITSLTMSGALSLGGALTGAGTVAASMLTGAINTAATISGNALSALFNASGLIASQIAGALNTAVTISGNAVSTLFNGSGLIASQIAGALNPAVTFLVGASNIALSTLLGNLNSTGQFVASAITGGLNTAVTISGNAISTLFSASGALASALTGVLATINIPNLAASIITSGTFSTGLIPNLAASIITSGSLALARIPTLPASIIDTASGVFNTLNIPNLPASIVTSGTFGTGLIPDITRAMSNDMGTIIDGLHQAVNGGSSTGNLASTIKTNLQSVFSNLFGSTSLGTVVQKAAVPNVTRDMSSDLQDTIDHAINALTGGSGSGNSAAALAAPLTTIPHSNIVPPSNPGSGISHDASTNGTPATGTSTSLSMTPWSHTVGATANYLVVRIGVLSLTSTGLAPAVSFGSQAMSLLASKSALSSGGHSNTLLIYGLLNPTPGSANVSVSASSGSAIYTLEAQATSLIGVASVGTSASTSGANSSPSQTVSSVTGNYVVNALLVNAYISSETLTSYSQTSRYNSGSTLSSGEYLAMLAGDAAGAASVTFSATASYTTVNGWLSAAVNLIPIPATVLGSGFRQTRVSTSTVTLAGNPAILPNSYFDTSDKLTSDLTYSSATANTLTISVAGWYAVTIKLLASASLGTSNVLLPALYQNGSIVRWGGSASAAARDASSSFDVWCNAGDTLQPGYAVASSISGVGEATGTRSYWEVTLANRGILS